MCKLFLAHEKEQKKTYDAKGEKVIETFLKDVPSAASLLNVSAVTIRRLVKKGKLPHRRIGDRVLFSDSDIQVFLDSCLVFNGKESK